MGERTYRQLLVQDLVELVHKTVLRVIIINISIASIVNILILIIEKFLHRRDQVIGHGREPPLLVRVHHLDDWGKYLAEQNGVSRV